MQELHLNVKKYLRKYVGFLKRKLTSTLLYQISKIKRTKRRIQREIGKIIGPKRHCNICGKSFKGKFEPIHSFFLENIKRTGYPYTFDDAETLNYKEYNCPFCQSSDRDRLYALYIKRYILHNKFYDLLDIAPSSSLKKFLKIIPNINYRSADLFMEDVDDKIDLMNMYVYSDNTFDIFICSHVLEHVMDDKKAMKELYRILKPGGFGIAMVPILLPIKDIDEDISITDSEERWRRFGQNDHVRLYSKQGYIDRLTETGFKVFQFTVNDFGLKKFILFGISPKSVLYIVSK